MANERISDLPAAGPILGPELVPVVQGGQTMKSTAEAIAQGGQSLGSQSLGLNATFLGSVVNAPLVSNWAFGTAAPSDPTAISIHDVASLTEFFNPLEDFTGSITINSEIETYATSFSTANFVFQSDRLNLQGLNPNSDWNNLVTQVSTSVNLNNTSTVIANLGLANTTGLRTGQIVAVQGKGLYAISAIVVDTSVTLQAVSGSPTTAVTSGLIFWLNVDSALLTVSLVNGTNLATFAATPAGVNGKQVCFAGGTNPIARQTDYRVATSDATTVTLDRNWVDVTVGIGTRLLFLPVVVSGQIWSKSQYDITNPQSFFAMEIDLVMLGGSNTTNISGVNTLAAFNALPTDVPWGAWPTFWNYSAADPLGVIKSQSISEIDVLELFFGTTTSYLQVTGTNHGDNIGIRFNKTDNGWSFNSTTGFVTAPFALTGEHKWQLIFTNGRTYRFVDNILWKVDSYEWAGQYAIQIACNLAIGSLLPAFASNVLFPQAVTNFPSLTLGIKTLKAWYQAP